MGEILLFTDGSVDPRANIGYGAYLALTDPDLSTEQLKAQVKTKRFEDTSSTKLELQTLLWALSDTALHMHSVRIFTDSQNIIGLMRRRERLERNDYVSQNGKRLKNHALYRAFYGMTDQLECSFVKLSGHKKSQDRDALDQLFTLVDRASRTALRANGVSA